MSNDGSVSQVIANRTKIISIFNNTEDLGQENSLYIMQLNTQKNGRASGSLEV